MYFEAAASAAGAQQGVRCRNPHLVRTTCRSMEDVYVLKKRLFLFVNISVLRLRSAKV